MFGQRSQLWWDVPVIDSFELLCDIYRVDHARYRKNLEQLTALLRLEELLSTPTRNLSLGQRMRCEIAASLLHDPKILFLDEPTIGLDAVSKLALRQFIRELNEQRGTTVVLTTHDMQDIEALAKRILLIGKGQILVDGSLEDLKKHVLGNRRLTASYDGAMPELCSGMTLSHASEGKMEIMLDPSVLSVPQAIAYLASGTALQDIAVSDITAEEMVAALYREYRI